MNGSLAFDEPPSGTGAPPLRRDDRRSRRGGWGRGMPRARTEVRVREGGAKPWSAVLPLVAALAIAGCGRGPAAAHLTSAQGEVTVQVGDDRKPARPGAALHDGDVVATADRSSAAVSFERAGVVSLGSNTALVIRRASATATQLGAVLLQGAVRAAGQPGGVRFTVGTPFATAEVGGRDAASEAAVSTTEGIEVLIGAIEVVSAGGKRETLDAGTSMTLEGIVVPVRPRIELPPITIVLAAKDGQVQVARAGAGTWQPAGKGEELKVGDAVRTRRARGTRLKVGDATGLALLPESELKVLPSRGAGSDALRYELVSGGALVELPHGAAHPAVHEVQLAGQTLTIEPGLTAADVEVHADPAGAGRVTVRQGRAVLERGTVVSPGRTATIGRGGTASVQPLAATRLELRAGSTSVVTYAGEVPPAALALGAVRGGPPYEVELATDRDFRDSVWHEKLADGVLVTDRLRPGRWFWRVRSTGGWTVGSIELAPERSAECRGCKRTNVIDDTGDNTVVYFQKTLPAITLRWAAVDGAASYRVRLFAGKAFAEPLLEEKVSGTTLALPAGKLSESKYFWLVQALSPDGRELGGGRINGLDIAYDNAVTDVQIRAPAHLARIDADEVVTSGEVRLGGRLAINGQSVALDRKGRFRETIALTRGENQLVYRTIAPNGVERFYVRQVVRP